VLLEIYSYLDIAVSAFDTTMHMGMVAQARWSWQ
jgi:hypothetical protein